MARFSADDAKRPFAVPLLVLNRYVGIPLDHRYSPDFADVPHVSILWRIAQNAD